MRLTLFLLFILGAQISEASIINPVPVSPGNLHLEFSETYFRTEENLSGQGGGFKALPNSGNFSEFQGKLGFDWDLTSSLRLRSRFDFSFVQTQTSNYSRENSHADKFGLGAEYWHIIGQTPLIFYTQGMIPIYKPDLNSIDAFGSDGAFNVDLGVYTRPRVGNFTGNFGVGYQWRNEGLSHLLPWNLGMSLSFDVGQIGGGLRGFHTLVKDSSNAAEKTKRSNAINNGQAGSLLYLSTDPEVQQLFVDSRWGILKGLDLSTDLAYDLNGKSYARGFYIGFALHWMINSHSFGKTSQSHSQNEDFEVPKERYRESVFEKADPTKRPRKRRKPAPQQKSIKQLLQDTEDELEP